MTLKSIFNFPVFYKKISSDVFVYCATNIDDLYLVGSSSITHYGSRAMAIEDIFEKIKADDFLQITSKEFYEKLTEHQNKERDIIYQLQNQCDYVPGVIDLQTTIFDGLPVPPIRMIGADVVKYNPTEENFTGNIH